MKSKEYIQGLRKAKNICIKYANRTQDYWVRNELVRELNELIKEENDALEKEGEQ